MQKFLWFVVSVMLCSCMWERDHDHDHDSWWSDYPDDELHSHHNRARDDRADACVSGENEADAAVADNELTPDTGMAMAMAADAGKPRCQSDSDCEGMAYCEQDTGACLPGMPCEDESSCDPGFNCDYERAVCAPADMERCSEMGDEAACAERSDCMTTYAGIDCTCGPDCTCMGGEPNCVCERFEFHVCEDASDATE